MFLAMLSMIVSCPSAASPDCCTAPLDLILPDNVDAEQRESHTLSSYLIFLILWLLSFLIILRDGRLITV